MDQSTGDERVGRIAGLAGDREMVTRARRARDEFSRFMLHYRFAVDELLTKISILKSEFEHLHDYSPIEHVTSRVKTVDSILGKARRRAYRSSARRCASR